MSFNTTLTFFDHSSRKELYEYSLPYVMSGDVRVIDVAPNFLLIQGGIWLSVLNASDNKVIATLPFCEDFSNIFYLSSKDLFLVVFEDDIKYFKIHNLEKNLSSLCSKLLSQ